MRYVHAREKMGRGATAVINCRRICQVALMDDPNFESFQLGRQAYCAARTDAGYSHKIAIPATNNWNIVLTYDGDHMTLLDYEIGVKDIRLG